MLKNHRDTFADNRMPRTLNRANVLSIIIERGPISRVGIARLSGLNQSTVSRIVSRLLEEGIVFEDRKGDSALGRKPINVKLNEKSRVIGAIVVNPWTTDIAVCNLSGQSLNTKRVVTIAEDSRNFLAACTSALDAMIRACDIPLAGVSVTVPGMVDSRKGIICQDPYLKWMNVDVRRIVREKIKCPVFVENDVRAGTLAEICFAEEAQNLSNFVFIMVDVGIWAGLAVNKSVYHGHSCLDGQIGANLVMKKDQGKTAVKMEALDNLASETRIVKHYYELLKSLAPENIDIEIRRVIWRAMNGEGKAVHVLKEAAGYLGAGLAGIDNLLNPDRLIISGKITRVWDLIFPEIITQMEKLSAHQTTKLRQRVIPSTLVWPSYEGASALVLRHLLGGYQIVHRQPVVKDWQTYIWDNWEKYEYEISNI